MIKVIYRTAVEKTAESLAKEAGDILLLRGQEVSWISCNSREDLEYAVSKEMDAVVLLHERDYSDERFWAWRMSEIRDIGRVRVVSCVRRIHYGTSFMAVLYAGGITDALFEDEADAEHIAERLIAKRNRKECREYYGIHSIQEVISVLQIIEQDTLERYIRFIDGGISREGMRERFEEVAKRLCYMEICFLVERLPENVLDQIGEGKDWKNIISKSCPAQRQ